ncbi:MAG TPA: hypothetical protein VJC12_03120 [Candidatus Paceibacterota bacterium]
MNLDSDINENIGRGHSALIRSPEIDRQRAEQKKRAGQVLQSAGKVLSKTGEGAIVGVPMQVAGTILRNRNNKQRTGDEEQETIGTTVPSITSEFSKDSKIVNESAQRSEKRNRVTLTTTYLMFGTALFFDSLQFVFSFVPFLGWILSGIVGIFAWLTFYTWTSIKGWGWSDTVKKIAINWALPLVEVFPIINGLPLWTLRVAIQIAIIKAEDVLYNSTQGKVDVKNILNFKSKYGAILKPRT